MITISLINFILTGNFGRISLGMTKNEVIEYLGNPNEVADFGTGASSLFYNGFEFFYWTDKEKIFAIQNDNLEILFTDKSKYKLNDNIIIDTSFFFFGQSLTYKHLTEYLKQESIKFDIIDRGEYDVIKFLSGVTFDFENKKLAQDKYDKGSLKLNGIRYEQID